MEHSYAVGQEVEYYDNWRGWQAGYTWYGPSTLGDPARGTIRDTKHSTEHSGYLIDTTLTSIRPKETTNG